MFRHYPLYNVPCNPGFQITNLHQIILFGSFVDNCRLWRRCMCHVTTMRPVIVACIVLVCLGTFILGLGTGSSFWRHFTVGLHQMHHAQVKTTLELTLFLTVLFQLRMVRRPKLESNYTNVVYSSRLWLWKWTVMLQDCPIAHPRKLCSCLSASVSNISLCVTLYYLYNVC